MKANTRIPRSLLCSVWLAFSSLACGAPATTVFTTSFEASEGFDAEFELSGQGGWIGEGSGATGLIADRFPDQGNQAYIGSFPPTNQGEFSTSIWKPLNYEPLTENKPIVTFTTTMEIADSTNGQRDDFRWSVYNAAAHRLFTLNFNNATAEICYVLDDNMGFQPTPYSFLRDTIYTLEIVMDFEGNVWSATLDSTLLLENQPITTSGADLDLGDIDAVWYYIDPDATGDNFMAFDNYTITAEAANPASPTIQITDFHQDGSVTVRLEGEPDATYVIESSDGLAGWSELKTASSGDGVIEHLDTAAALASRRFYRARLMP